MKNCADCNNYKNSLKEIIYSGWDKQKGVRMEEITLTINKGEYEMIESALVYLADADLSEFSEHDKQHLMSVMDKMEIDYRGFSVCG